MRIDYTKHALLKLKEREIGRSEVQSVLRTPEELLLDIETGNLISVGKREDRENHLLIVVYSPEIRKVVTVIDTSKVDILQKRKENGRWVKIR